MMDDRHSTARTERRGLLLSVFGGLFMAALGLGFALLTESGAVLLDGVFSLIGTAVALVSIRVACMVRRPDDEQFHFGYALYEPMLNLGKGLLIAVVTVFASVAAVQAILAGGREVRGGMAVAYALIAAAGCFVLSLVQRRMARRTDSPLLQVDSRNWFVDGLLSVGVALAFAATVLMRGTGLEWLTPYADPAVVIALSLASSPIPIGIVRANWNQIMGRAPDAEIQHEAWTRVEAALEGTPGVTPHLRILETGRVYYLQLYLVVAPESELKTLEEMDRLRERLERSVRQENATVGLDVIFTRDEHWTRQTIPN
jgi:cation diffusion facilitator family transporter